MKWGLTWLTCKNIDYKLNMWQCSLKSSEDTHTSVHLDLTFCYSPKCFFLEVSHIWLVRLSKAFFVFQNIWHSLKSIHLTSLRYYITCIAQKVCVMMKWGLTCATGKNIQCQLNVRQCSLKSSEASLTSVHLDLTFWVYSKCFFQTEIWLIWLVRLSKAFFVFQNIWHSL